MTPSSWKPAQRPGCQVVTHAPLNLHLLSTQFARAFRQKRPETKCLHKHSHRRGVGERKCFEKLLEAGRERRYFLPKWLTSRLQFPTSTNSFDVPLAVADQTRASRLTTRHRHVHGKAYVRMIWMNGRTDGLYPCFTGPFLTSLVTRSSALPTPSLGTTAYGRARVQLTSWCL